MSLTLQSIGKISDQAAKEGWSSGIYDFGKAKHADVDYFNPTLVKWKDKKFLIVRRAHWKNRKTDEFGVNDLVAFEMQGKMPIRGTVIGMQARFPNEHFEDPRVVIHDGRMLVSCCNFTWAKNGWSGAHQMVAHVDPDDGWKVLKQYHPVYGGNGEALGLNKGHEKNWIYYVDGGGLSMVYSTSPFVRVHWRDGFVEPEELKFEWDSSLWGYGEIRGGTPPVLVDGLYYTFFHSSTPWVGPKRQYHMGCMTFKEFGGIKSITPYPLLTGSSHDRWGWPKPACIFPGGCLVDKDLFYIAFGVNDLDCGWVEIPFDSLKQKMIDL